MTYVVFARKYRPQRFEEVVGQEAVATTLKNAILEDRVAHAYLFCGPRGVGKTSMARILSKALNCVEGPTVQPCGKCDICTHIAAGDDMDVIELDGASNRGIDEVRQIRDNVRYASNRARFKIFIIDEVHMLTKEAFNALLKTLEEPPAHVKFIFATTEVHRIPETILSRCQRFDFRRITPNDIVKRLRQICEAEGVDATEDTLRAIARYSRGAMRDSQSLLDKLISFGHQKLTPELLAEAQGYSSFEDITSFVDALAEKKAAHALLTIDRLVEQGRDLGEFLAQVIEYLRTMLLFKVGGQEFPLIQATEDELVKVKEQAPAFSADTLLYMVQLLSETRRQLRSSDNPRILVELAAVKLARMEDLKPLQEVIDRLSRVQRAIEEGTGTTSPARGAGSHAPVGLAGSPGGVSAQYETRPVAAPAASPGDAANSAGARQDVEDTPHPRASPQNTPPGEVSPSAPGVQAGTSHGVVDAAAAPTQLTKETLAAQWPQVIEQVTREKNILGMQLRQAHLLDVSDGTVRIGFGPSDAPQMKRVERPDMLRFIEETVWTVTGFKVRLKVVAMEEDVPAHAASTESRETAGQAEARSVEQGPTPGEIKEAATEQDRPFNVDDFPILKKVMEAFDAQVVNVYRAGEQEEESVNGEGASGSTGGT